MKKILIFLVALTIVLGLTISSYAITITDTATGSTTPPITFDASDVINGDFLIWANDPVLTPAVGNGADEQTTWQFDYTAYPNLLPFPPLSSALLTLTLTPRAGDIITDQVIFGWSRNGYYSGLPFIETLVIQGLPVGVTNTVQLELLDFFSSADILGVLTANGGRIPMRYSDDAVVSFEKGNLANSSSDLSFISSNDIWPSTPYRHTLHLS